MMKLLGPEKSPSQYTNENLRFRKAYIRERLADLKTEREALIDERSEIDRRLDEEKSPKSSIAHSSSDRA